MRDPLLTARAKEMRKAPSEPEQRMWLALRAKRFACVKFRRQKAVGPYIVDFAARDPMVVIEIDGDTHAGRAAYDSYRTAFLESQGYRVVQFANADVMHNLDGVMSSIEQLVRTPPLPTCSAVLATVRGAVARPSTPEGERAI